MDDQRMMTSADFCVAASSAVASRRSHPAGVLWGKRLERSRVLFKTHFRVVFQSAQ